MSRDAETRAGETVTLWRWNGKLYYQHLPPDPDASAEDFIPASSLERFAERVAGELEARANRTTGDGSFAQGRERGLVEAVRCPPRVRAGEGGKRRTLRAVPSLSPCKSHPIRGSHGIMKLTD
jgi:hypothetical protein